MRWTRREFLRAGSLTALGAGLGFTKPDIFEGNAAAARVVPDTKLIFIFQRGGSDGVNTVMPYGDSEYNTANRPTLFIPRTSAIDLGNDFAGLHPRMAPMMEIYNHSALTGTDGPGNLAIVHRVGYAGQSKSHFDSRQYWENGVPGDPSLEEGMIYRQVALTMNPLENHLVAASMSNSQMVALKGPLPVAAIDDVETFSFSGDPAGSIKFIGHSPSTQQGSDGSGLLGAYGGPHDFPEKPYRDLVYGTGLAAHMPEERSPALAMTVDHLFGEIWSRPGLSLRDRRLVVLGATAMLGRADLIEVQVRGALINGELTEDELEEIVLQLHYYAGWGNGTAVQAGVDAALASWQNGFVAPTD